MLWEFFPAERVVPGRAHEFSSDRRMGRLALLSPTVVLAPQGMEPAGITDAMRLHVPRNSCIPRRASYSVAEQGLPGCCGGSFPSSPGAAPCRQPLARRKAGVPVPEGTRSFEAGSALGITHQRKAVFFGQHAAKETSGQGVRTSCEADFSFAWPLRGKRRLCSKRLRGLKPAPFLRERIEFQAEACWKSQPFFQASTPRCVAPQRGVRALSQ